MGLVRLLLRRDDEVFCVPRGESGKLDLPTRATGQGDIDGSGAIAALSGTVTGSTARPVFLGAVRSTSSTSSGSSELVGSSEIHIGDSLLTIADRKPTWPYTPAFTRVYVADAAGTLERAVAHGARIVTEPTEFWGDVFSRFTDPFGHLWWVYQHTPAQQESDADSHTADSSGDTQEWDAAEAGESWENFATPELDYIHSTLIDAMNNLRDPREKS